MPLTQEAPVPAGVLLQASGGCRVPPLPGKTPALLSLRCFPASNTAESVVLPLFRQASQHLLGIYCEPDTFCTLYMCLLIRPTQQRWRERDTIIHFTDAEGEVGGFIGFAPNPTIRGISVESGLEFRVFQL